MKYREKIMKRLTNKIICGILAITTMFLFACGTPVVEEEGPITQRSVVESNDFSANDNYAEFLSKAKTDFIVPALSEGLVPQGMDASEESDLIFISGYFKSYDKHPSSMIVTVDGKTGKLKGYYYIKNSNGNYNKGHLGGIAVTSKNLFIADGGKLYRIPLSQLQTVQSSYRCI